jgi:CRP-like cAMP-binding protein
MTLLRNQILALTGDADRSLLAPDLEPCEMSRGERLERAGEPIDFVYFPESGICSVIAIAPHGRRVEVGPFGREGMSGLAIVLGAATGKNETAVQIGGSAHRIKTEALVRAIERSRPLHWLLLRYVQAFMVQTAETLLVNSYAGIEQRLARWILMSQDRTDGRDLAITHEYISEMLAVRRPGVTEAIQMIEGRGLIRATRGLVTVLDRTGLAALAGAAYGVSEAEYQRVVCNR